MLNRKQCPPYEGGQPWSEATGRGSLTSRAEFRPPYVDFFPVNTGRIQRSMPFVWMLTQ
jgi:hypothetical protein